MSTTTWERPHRRLSITALRAGIARRSACAGTPLPVQQVAVGQAAVERASRSAGADATLADFFRKHPGRRVLIEGHTDRVGSIADSGSGTKNALNRRVEVDIADGDQPVRPRR